MPSTNSELSPAPASAPRIAIRLPLTVEFERGGSVEGVSENLSETGALVLTSREAAPGTIITLKFQAFEAIAEIIWTRSVRDAVRIGLRFTSLEPRGWEFIHGFSEYLRRSGDSR